MTEHELIRTLQSASSQLSFADCLAVIDAHYDFTPCAFDNGTLKNTAGENNGSCKIFAFGRLHQLSPEQTLACFGEHYQGVLDDPAGQSHQNIRNFIKQGWAGVHYYGQPLTPKV
ncbi:HopJ type III effector protein [Oceanisphaera avium]|uniref:Type III effector n=1 Tax=Oceanisphaera avium TaxID=1903694 RepID=A0A1Y0CYF6_9GAMM|nr:HopJ type III effector protein [Oceanisphaera avium]ART79875.1 type III effector [Oceanisphaera avium]